jgi:hypothetical protein
MSRIARCQAGTHQLISFQPLLTPQAADSFAVGIGRNSARSLDGWFHVVLGELRNTEYRGDSFPD